MDELIGLLEDKKEEVRVEASTAVAGLTGSVDGKQLLQTSGSKLFPVLLRLLHDESAKVTAQVYATLVNLSLDEGACRQLLTLGVGNGEDLRDGLALAEVAPVPVHVPRDEINVTVYPTY